MRLPVLRSLSTSALFAALLALLVLPGCRPGSALHGRYNNFRAYYNTYYNASRKLKAGEEALLSRDAVVERTRLVELFPTGAAGAQNPAFQETIDKSAELLRNRPDSKWADDALLLIGKAYFYQRNFVGAEQKFRETADAAEVRGERRLADEARFWIGRTMAAADRFDEGVAVLQEALTTTDGDRYWRSRMTLALGELYARAGRWEDASATLRDGVDAARDSDLEARAYMLLGQVEEQAGNYVASAEAYGRAGQVSRSYEMTYAAQISEALVRGLDAGGVDEALALIRAMARDDKNYARRAEVALVRGRLLAAAGNEDAALEQLRDVLYDRDLAGQAVRGEAHVRLAEFYRDYRNDFILAAAHFDTAATATPTSVTAGQRPSRAAILGVRDLARTFGTISTSSQRIADLDSLLALGVMSDEDFRSRIDEIEAARYEVWLADQRRADAVRAAQDFGGDAPGLPRGGAGGAGSLPGAGGAAATDVSGFLGYRDPSIVQAGQIAFERTWGDRPLGLNWRRRAALQTATIAESGQPGTGPNGPRRGVSGGPPPLDLSGIPRTPEAQRNTLIQRAELRYELGNAFFLSLGRLDLAADLYRLIVEETPDAPVANRARYALAEVEAEAGRPDSARPIYSALAASVPDGILGEAARARLEGREPATAPEAAPDSSALAFDAARAVWSAGDPRAAATEMVAIGEAHPDAPVAPRAYLAAAYAFVASVGADTLALISPLPPDLSAPRLRETAASSPTETPPPQSPRPQQPQRQIDENETLAPSEPVGGAPRPVGAPAPVGQAPQMVGASPVPDPDLDEAPADSLDSQEAPPAILLADYLRALATRYPGTPSAARATALSAALPVPPPPPAPPEPPPGPLTEPPPSAVDSLNGLDESESPIAPDDGTLRGTLPIDPALGGVTWRAQGYESREEAEVILRPLRAAGFRVRLAIEDETVVVVLGQFETPEEAERHRLSLPAWAQVRAVVVPVETLTFLDDPDAPPGDGKDDGVTGESP